MEPSLFATLVASPWFACGLLFALLLAALYAGRFFGLKRAAHAEDSPGTGAINGTGFIRVDGFENAVIAFRRGE